MKAPLKYLLFAASFTSLLAGCQDAFIETITIGPYAFPPKLAVTAVLDNDTTGLQMNVGVAYAFQTYQGRSNKEARAVIRLFENDKAILTHERIIQPELEGGIPFSFPNIKTTVGATYRLEIKVEGYPQAVAEAVMPDAPVLSDIKFDKDKTIEWKQVQTIYSLEDNYYEGSTTTNPLSFRLAAANQKTYYVMGMRQWVVYRDDISKGTAPSIITTNPLLIQANPDYESKQNFFDLDQNLSGAYRFEKILFSNAAFLGTSHPFTVYLTSKWYYTTPLNSDGTPSLVGMGCRTEQNYLYVTAISRQTYEIYRAMSFQAEGTGFFTEPMPFPSNFENAEGSFSVQHTVYHHISSDEICAAYTNRP